MLTMIIVILIGALTLLTIRTKRQTTSIIDTSRELNSPVAAIKKLTSRLSPRAWIIVIFVLGLLFGIGSNMEANDWPYYLIIWCASLMILAVGLIVNLPRYGLKIVAYAVFMISSLSSRILNYPRLVDEIYDYIVFVTIAWLILKYFAMYALQSGGRTLKYPSFIIWWLLIFTFSLVMKELMFIAIAFVLLIKGYQLFLVDKWTLRRAKVYGIRMLYPLGLCAIFLTYIYYATQIVENKANEVAQQTLAYYDKNGKYPTKEQVKATKAEDDIRYLINEDGKPLLSYWQPATIPNIDGRFDYDFETKSWRRYSIPTAAKTP